MKTLLDCISAKRARALIAAGANVNAQDYYGCTPLHYAAYSGFIVGAERAEIVHMLIAAGADPSIRNDRGRTPADICAGASDIFAPETASN